MIKKMKAYLANNLILSVVLAAFLAVVVGLIWKYTLHSATDAVSKINSISEQHAYETDDENLFEYTALGTIYHAPTGRTVGPFKYLYTDELYFRWEAVARYIGDNGKYGYINKDGSLLTEPIFINAAEFEDGTARVQEEVGKVYYINDEGERITRDYQDGSLTFEMQGSYCRVQEFDGTWGIINREDEMIFSGAEIIEELPMVTCLGSAVVDGKAVLFELFPFEQSEEEIKIIANYDSFVKISYVYGGEFAFVWTKDNLMGVVNYKGEVIIPAIYPEIEFEYYGEDMDEPIFLASDKKGMIHVIRMKGESASEQ